MKICTDCKYYREIGLAYDGLCMRNVDYECSVINGKVIVFSAESCSKMRRDSTRCSKEGNWFEENSIWSMIVNHIKFKFSDNCWPLGLRYDCWELTERTVDRKFWHQLGIKRKE